MNKLYKNLQELLEKKIGLYEKFIQLLNEEWKCVTNYSYDGLQEIIAKKDDQVLQMQVLENNRLSLMKKIASNLKVGQSGLTLKKSLVDLTALAFSFVILSLAGMASHCSSVIPNCS